MTHDFLLMPAGSRSHSLQVLEQLRHHLEGTLACSKLLRGLAVPRESLRGEGSFLQTSDMQNYHQENEIDISNNSVSAFLGN